MKFKKVKKCDAGSCCEATLIMESKFDSGKYCSPGTAGV